MFVAAALRFTTTIREPSRLGTATTALGSVKKGIDQLTVARTAAAIQAAPAPASQPLAEAAAKSKRAAFDAQADPINAETAQLESV